MAGIIMDRVITVNFLRFAVQHPLHEGNTAIKSGFVSINVGATDMDMGINAVIAKSGSG